METVAYRVEEGVVFKCPKCDKTNFREGFEELFASICEHCGAGVTISENKDGRGETL